MAYIVVKQIIQCGKTEEKNSSLSVANVLAYL